MRRIESKINSSRLRALSLDIVRAVGKTPIRGVWPMALADGMVGGPFSMVWQVPAAPGKRKPAAYPVDHGKRAGELIARGARR